MFPNISKQEIEQDLMRTRNVKATCDNIRGKTKSQKDTVQMAGSEERQTMYQLKKETMIQEARKRFLAKNKD